MTHFNLMCIVIGLCGTGISTLGVLYNLSKKAAQAKVIFSPRGYFTTDWYAPAISLLAIFMAVIALPYIPIGWQNSPGAILVIFATIGYSGNDIVSRFFSITNGRINAAIGYKAAQSDEMNGIPVGTRTPAAPIKKEPATPPIPPPNQ